MSKGVGGVEGLENDRGHRSTPTKHDSWFDKSDVERSLERKP